MSAAADPSFGSPDSGVETLAKEIGFLVGLPVDYYAAVDLQGFVDIVQAMGGVDVNVTTAVDDPFTGTFVPNWTDPHGRPRRSQIRSVSREQQRTTRARVASRTS